MIRERKGRYFHGPEEDKRKKEEKKWGHKTEKKKLQMNKKGLEE